MLWRMDRRRDEVPPAALGVEELLLDLTAFFFGDRERLDPSMMRTPVEPPPLL